MFSAVFQCPGVRSFPRLQLEGARPLEGANPQHLESTRGLSSQLLNDYGLLNPVLMRVREKRSLTGSVHLMWRGCPELWL